MFREFISFFAVDSPLIPPRKFSQHSRFYKNRIFVVLLLLLNFGIFYFDVAFNWEYSYIILGVHCIYTPLIIIALGLNIYYEISTNLYYYYSYAFNLDQILLVIIKIVIIFEGIKYGDPSPRIALNFLVLFNDPIRNFLIYRYLDGTRNEYNTLITIDYTQKIIAFLVLIFSSVISAMNIYSITKGGITYSDIPEQAQIEEVENYIIVYVYVNLAALCYNRLTRISMLPGFLNY